MMKIVFSVFCVLLVGSWANNMGPVKIIDFIGMRPCKNSPNVGTVSYFKDKNNKKAFSITLDLKEDFNNMWTYQADVHKWTGTEFKKNTMKLSGKICDEFNKRLPTPRDRLYKLLKVSGKCNIKAGKYSGKGLTSVEKELKVDQVPYGKYQADLNIYNPQKKLMACYVVDVELKQ